VHQVSHLCPARDMSLCMGSETDGAGRSTMLVARVRVARIWLCD
jgi:hypothetical protein